MVKLKLTEKAQQLQQLLSDDHPLQKVVVTMNEGFPVVSDDRGAHHYFS